MTDVPLFRYRNFVRGRSKLHRIQAIESEQDMIARVANSVRVQSVAIGASVLILDDTIRSGGTVIEVSRALREAGAHEVYALSVAKVAKFTLGGVDLTKERWE